MNNEIKPGDFVRLTDPLDNGTIVRIDEVNENGLAEWLGGSQASDMEQIKANVQIGDCSYYISLSSIIGAIEQGFETDGFNIKLYPESAVEYWKHRAEIAEQNNALNEKLLDKEHNKLLDAQDYIKKVCKESSADIQRLDTENKELSDSNDKLRFSLSERETEIERIKDEHKKEMDEYRAVYFRQNKILVEQNNALKRQLDESNKQIEIYAKKVRNLEVDLEEGGFNDERNFI